MDIGKLVLNALADYEPEVKEKEVDDTLESYLKRYDTVTKIETKLKVAKRQKEDARLALVAYMEAIVTSQLKRHGRTVSHSKRSFGRVTDFDEYIDWITNMSGEPRSQFLEEVAIKGSVKDPRGIRMLVEEAQLASIEHHKPLEDYLPPGLAYATVDVITVRKSRQETKRIPVTAAEKYREMTK